MTTRDLASVSILEDPVRRRLYEIVSSRSEPVGRDEAASAAGIGRPLAAYHLDKLVESGLLMVTYQRLGGRSGPGAGRPAKLYTRSDREFAVSVPPRDYELAARIMAEALADDQGGTSRAAVRDAAYRLGVELTSPGRASPGRASPGRASPGRASPGPAQGRPAHARPAQAADEHQARAADEHQAPAADEQGLDRVLSAHGYEPTRQCADSADTTDSDTGGTGVTRDTVIRLRNCPFHHLVERHRDLVCTMNLSLIDGMVAGLDLPGWQPVLDPWPGHCCVAIEEHPQPAEAEAEAEAEPEEPRS